MIGGKLTPRTTRSHEVGYLANAKDIHMGICILESFRCVHFPKLTIYTKLRIASRSSSVAFTNPTPTSIISDDNLVFWVI